MSSCTHKHGEHFNPQAYDIVDYLDGKMPVFAEFVVPGASHGEMERATEAWKSAREQWLNEWKSYFPAGVQRHCHHCGQQIRYVAVAQHTGGEFVAFGVVCAERIGMNPDQYRVKHIKDVAARRNNTRRLGSRFGSFMVEHPELDEAFTWHQENGQPNDFINDIYLRAVKYAKLSEKQIAAVIKAVERDRTRAERLAAMKAKDADLDDLEGGRREFHAEVLSIKEAYSDFGPVTKLLLKLDTGNKIYGNCPQALRDTLKRGQIVKLKATIKVSDKDSKFGFFSRAIDLTG